MLAGPWQLPDVAEAAAADLAHWPSWLDPLALHVISVYRRAPAGGPGGLAHLIEDFITEHRAGPEVREPPPIRREATATRTRAAPAP